MMQGMEMPEMQGSNDDAIKNALQMLIKAMYGKMDYGEGDEPMEAGEMGEAIEAEPNNYDPIAEGDAEPQAGESEGSPLDPDLKDEIASFMNPKNPNAGKKSMTVMSVSKSPAKKKTRSRKKKMGY